MGDEQNTQTTDFSANEGTNDISTTQDIDSTQDNSQGEEGLSLSEKIAKALKEPNIVDEDDSEGDAQGEQNKDNSIDCPDKFKREDGTPDWDKVLKSYTELESNSSKKEAEWKKERAELLKFKEQQEAVNKAQEQQAISAGFNSLEDMTQVYEIASLEANEYAKYLGTTDNPDEVRNLLIQYANNPSAELMEEIELEFAPEVNKRVAIASERLRQTYESQRAERNQTAKMASIENVISQSVDENSEIFNYTPFRNMFVNTLQKFGDSFTFEDAKVLMQTFDEMKELYRAEFEKESGIKLQNKQATDKISGIITNNSAPATKQLSNPDISTMTDAELRKEIRKYL